MPGKANIMREGGDVAIIAMGLMVAEALKAADLLAAEGIRATVVNMHTVKPVSYTHLDVYKRQVYWCGASNDPFDTQCVLFAFG